MLFDINARPLLEKYKAARDTEAAAVDALLAALKSGRRDNSTLEALTENMEDAHRRAMKILEELHVHRLDKA
jgi:hypothetical protein